MIRDTSSLLSVEQATQQLSKKSSPRNKDENNWWATACQEEQPNYIFARLHPHWRRRPQQPFDATIPPPNAPEGLPRQCRLVPSTPPSDPSELEEDNLNDVCLESSKLAVATNVKTKVEPSSMHRETVASTIRVAQASSKSSSGGSRGSSNPSSLHLKAKVHLREERDHLGGQYLDYNS